MSHPPEHEDLLRDLALGEREPTDPEVREVLAGCPECAQRLADLEYTRERLELAAARQREELEELEEAAELELEPHRERIERELRRLAGEDPRLRPYWLRTWGVLLAVAALALAIVGIFVWPRLLPSPSSTPVYLSEEGLSVIEPKGAVEEYTRFAWEYDGSAGARFTLRIYELTGEGRGALLVEETLDDDSWTPSLRERGRLSSRILWEVDGFDAFGGPDGSASASAWLSPR